MTDRQVNKLFITWEQYEVVKEFIGQLTQSCNGDEGMTLMGASDSLMGISDLLDAAS